MPILMKYEYSSREHYEDVGKIECIIIQVFIIIVSFSNCDSIAVVWRIYLSCQWTADFVWEIVVEMTLWLEINIVSN
jgi:hypothetical protein